MDTIKDIQMFLIFLNVVPLVSEKKIQFGIKYLK